MARTMSAAIACITHDNPTHSLASTALYGQLPADLLPDPFQITRGIKRNIYALLGIKLFVIDDASGRSHPSAGHTSQPQRINAQRIKPGLTALGVHV